MTMEMEDDDADGSEEKLNQEDDVVGRLRQSVNHIFKRFMHYNTTNGCRQLLLVLTNYLILAGLSSQQALNKLIEAISSVLQDDSSISTSTTETKNEEHGNKLPKLGVQWKTCFDLDFLAKTFSVNNQTALFSWAALLASLLHVIALAFCGGILTQVNYCSVSF